MSKEHRSGFVNIIGRPNVGKSTLMNALVGERMSIISPKAQTTRHRILGIVNEDDYQIVFSDTPGIIYDPHYKMQLAMNRFAFSALEDADVLLIMTDVFEEQFDEDDEVIKMLRSVKIPKFLLINKIDIRDERVEEIREHWENLKIDGLDIRPISALQKDGLESLLKEILAFIPEFPPYYPKDQLTDKPEKFFISELIREKILFNYKQEIPYATEVVVNSFKETEKNDKPFVYIDAEIYVMRRSQKQILIGKNGSKIKQLGIDARASIEAFLGKRVHLQLYVRVKEKWRDDKRILKNFGYIQS
jgi:GTP-binding protein Era